MNTVENKIDEFVHLCEKHISEQSFLKISLGNYQGNEAHLKNIYIKKVIIKRVEMLAFTYRYQTKDVHKNYTLNDGIAEVVKYLGIDFFAATLFTTNTEYILSSNKNIFQLKIKHTNKQQRPDLSHNRLKNRLVPQDAPFLQKLGLSDGKGEIFKTAQDKYKQIDKYIEILSGLIKETPDKHINRVVDMGSGKGYLTFALYDYLNSRQNKVEMIGVEYRQDMVELCNNYANELHFDGLHFERGTIESYKDDKIDLLIALHACDTATDDAIAKGIAAQSSLIVVAPCCHKQIRREIEQHKVKNQLSFLTRYGIFLERQAEMVTDGLRTLIMEYFGYKTKAFQFVSDVHTPKNVMLVGVKSTVKTKAEKESILQKIRDTKAYFGISYHHLEKVLDLS